MSVGRKGETATSSPSTLRITSSRARPSSTSVRSERAGYVDMAARNADVMFGCYGSALGGGRVALGGAWPDTLVDAVEQLAVPTAIRPKQTQKRAKKSQDQRSVRIPDP